MNNMLEIEGPQLSSHWPHTYLHVVISINTCTVICLDPHKLATTQCPATEWTPKLRQRYWPFANVVNVAIFKFRYQIFAKFDLCIAPKLLEIQNKNSCKISRIKISSKMSREDWFQFLFSSLLLVQKLTFDLSRPYQHMVWQWAMMYKI